MLNPQIRIYDLYKYKSLQCIYVDKIFPQKNIIFYYLQDLLLFVIIVEQREENEMVILSESDMFEVKITSLLADYDRETITNLYQPIIGYTALAIYFSFWSVAFYRG